MSRPLALDARFKRRNPDAMWSEVLDGWYDRKADKFWPRPDKFGRLKCYSLSVHLQRSGLETALIEEEAVLDGCDVCIQDYGRTDDANTL